MSLKIHAKIPSLPVSPRELIQPIQNPHRIKVYSLLKPWHPFFVFEVLKEDLGGTVDFRISVKPIESKGKILAREFPSASVLGVFPWADCPGSPADKYERFQLYVFDCLTRLIVDGFGRPSLMPREMGPMVVGGSPNWTRVCKWLEQFTEPLAPWFDRHTTVNDGRLHFILSQTQALKFGEPVCGWWMNTPKGPEQCHKALPIDVANIPVSAIEKECAELGDQAEAMLKKYLTEQIVNAFYYMRFAL